MKKGIVFIIGVALFGLLFAWGASAQTTTEHTVEADTEALWHMDGSVASAGKKDNAETTATYDLTENGAVGSATGFNSEADGAYGTTGSANVYLRGGDLDLPSGAWTVEAWIHFDSLSGTPTIISKDEGGNTNAGDFRLTYNQDVAGKLSALIQAGGTNTIVDSGTFSFSIDTWYYVAVTNGATNLTMYINGAQTDQEARSLPISNTNQWTFSCDSANGANNCWDGDFDEVRLSSTEHSSATILAYYESGVGGGTTTTTTTSTSTPVINTTQDIANGLYLFFIMFFGLLFYFKPKGGD